MLDFAEKERSSVLVGVGDPSPHAELALILMRSGRYSDLFQLLLSIDRSANGAQLPLTLVAQIRDELRKVYHENPTYLSEENSSRSQEILELVEAIQFSHLLEFDGGFCFPQEVKNAVSQLEGGIALSERTLDLYLALCTVSHRFFMSGDHERAFATLQLFPNEDSEPLERHICDMSLEVLRMSFLNVPLPLCEENQERVVDLLSKTAAQYMKFLIMYCSGDLLAAFAVQLREIKKSGDKAEDWSQQRKLEFSAYSIVVRRLMDECEYLNTNTSPQEDTLMLLKERPQGIDPEEVKKWFVKHLDLVVLEAFHKALLGLSRRDFLPDSLVFERFVSLRKDWPQKMKLLGQKYEDNTLEYPMLRHNTTLARHIIFESLFFGRDLNQSFVKKYVKGHQKTSPALLYWELGSVRDALIPHMPEGESKTFLLAFIEKVFRSEA